jgi:hypothetical protein
MKITKRKFMGGVAASAVMTGVLRPQSVGSAPGWQGVYAHAGETVTCENGHPICEFVETVYLGQSQDLERQLGKWRQKAPKTGSGLPQRCVQCDARWAEYVGVFHFKDGWRDPHRYIA